MKSNNPPHGSLRDRLNNAIKNGAPSRRLNLKPLRNSEEMLQHVLTTCRWSLSEIAADSPYNIIEPPKDHHLLHFRFYEEDDNIWCAGTVHQSGSPCHASMFRPVSDWSASPTAPGALICPNPLNPGVISRRDSNLMRRKYFVVRPLGLAQNEMGSIFRWIMKKGFTLRAVVDTVDGLEGWFDCLELDKMTELNRKLAVLKCDTHMFSPSHPCVLPGSIHNGQYSRLIYFNL